MRVTRQEECVAVLTTSSSSSPSSSSSSWTPREDNAIVIVVPASRWWRCFRWSCCRGSFFLGRDTVFSWVEACESLFAVDEDDACTLFWALLLPNVKTADAMIEFWMLDVLHIDVANYKQNSEEGRGLSWLTDSIRCFLAGGVAITCMATSSI